MDKDKYNIRTTGPIIGQCIGDDQHVSMSFSPDKRTIHADRGELEQVKTELLAWAGLHRGKAINENAMSRFHEIIDRLDAIIK